MKINGRIENKEVVQGDDWTRAVFVIDGKKYSTFDDKIYNVFKTGDIIEMETKETVKDGKTYNNMVSMKKSEEKVGEVVNAAQNGSVKEFHLSIEECRARALECALDSGIKDTVDVLNLSKIYFEFIYNGNTNNKKG